MDLIINNQWKPARSTKNKIEIIKYENSARLNTSNIPKQHHSNTSTFCRVSIYKSYCLAPVAPYGHSRHAVSYSIEFYTSKRWVSNVDYK